MRLTPRGGSDRVDGVCDGVLRVRVAAAPVDGAANASLIRLLAHQLGVPAGAVRIVGGDSARTKRVAVDGLTARDLQAHWPDLPL